MLHSRPAESELSTAIWDDETGETWAEALARFATFGPLMNAREALAYLSRNPGTDMMAFGYGEDPEDFDSIDWDELAESVRENGLDTVDAIWGPFAPWLNS